MATRTVGAVPPAFLAGNVTLILLALWIAFSCSRWFGITGVGNLPDVTLERIGFGILVGYAVTTFAMGRRPFGNALPAEIGLWGFAIACAVSGYVHGAFEGTEAANSMNALSNSLLYPAIAFMIVLRTRTTRRDLIRFSAILTVFAIYLGITALLEKSPFTWALVPPSIRDPAQGIHFGRARGPFLNAAFTGTVMVQLLPIVLLSRGLGGRAWRGVTAVAVGLLCLGAYLTDTRAVLLSLMVVTVIGSILSGPSRRAYRFILGILLLAAVVRYAGGGPVVPRQAEVAPIDARLNLFLATGEILLAHPVTGSGFRTFAKVHEEYYNAARVFGDLAYKDSLAERSSHNALLTPLAELGLLAGGLYLVLLIRAVANGLRAPVGGSPEERAVTRQLMVCSLLVGIPFLVNGLAVEFQSALTPNALFWTFAAFSERHLQLRKLAGASLAPARSVGQAAVEPGLLPARHH